MADTEIGKCTGLGEALAHRLGLPILGIEGHDLKVACIKCESSDAFRIHRDEGIGYCYSCQVGWSPLQIAEECLGNREDAAALMSQLEVTVHGNRFR